MMRILFLSPYFLPDLGGIERSIIKLSEGYISKGHKVGVLTSKFLFPKIPSNYLIDCEVLKDITIFRINSKPLYIPDFLSAVPFVNFSERDIRKYIDEFKPDIIHFIGDGWFDGYIKAIRHCPKSCKIIITPSFHKLSFDKKFWLKPFNQKIFDSIEAVVSITEYEKKELLKEFKILPDKIIVIPWGVDLNHQKIEKPSGTKIKILSVGRLGKHKDQLKILESISLLKSDIQKRIELVLIGKEEDMGYRNLLLEKYKQLCLSIELKILGEVPEETLRNYYSQSDLFILLSNYEAFGLVYFEAMSYSIPVITHNNGPISELSEVNGVVITKKGDKGMIAQKLGELILSKNYRDTLSKNAFETSKKYTWKKTVNSYIDLYKTIIF